MNSVKISLIVPIGGNCPYFVGTNLLNVVETCGLSLEEFDFIFLTGKYIKPQLQEAFCEYSKTHTFKVVQCPFASNWHLNMLDWVFYNVDLGDWVFLQHMDTFWKPDCIPWLSATKSIIENHPELLFITTSDCHVHLLDEVPHQELNDYVGAFNQKEIVKRNLKFKSGHLCKLNLSDKLMKYINEGRFLTKKHKPVKWLDGSSAMGMEVAIHWPESLRIYDYGSCLIHPWDFIRPLFQTRQHGKNLYIGRTKYNFFERLENEAIISFITSTCIEHVT